MTTQLESMKMNEKLCFHLLYLTALNSVASFLQSCGCHSPCRSTHRRNVSNVMPGEHRWRTWVTDGTFVAFLGPWDCHHNIPSKLSLLAQMRHQSPLHFPSSPTAFQTQKICIDRNSSTYTLGPWWWWQYVPLKCLQHSPQPHVDNDTRMEFTLLINHHDTL
jgi:hypothetical protein